jgi:hypothetical protein
MSEKVRNTAEIQSELFSNKERINKLTEKISVLKELAGETQ